MGTASAVRRSPCLRTIPQAGPGLCRVEIASGLLLDFRQKIAVLHQVSDAMGVVFVKNIVGQPAFH